MNAELIKALRRCSYTTVAGADREDGYCKPCAYFAEDTSDITCIDRMMIDAADALEAAEKKIAELEAQMPKECEFKSYADKIPNARNRYCTQCGAYLSDEEFDNHTVRYCYWCGSKVKGEQE